MKVLYAVIPALALLSVGCSKYLSRDLTRDDAAQQLNNWRSLDIRPVTFTDEQFQCGLGSGLWKYAGEPRGPDGIVFTAKGDSSGFLGYHCSQDDKGHHRKSKERL
jgi:hypothetical protein